MSLVTLHLLCLLVWALVPALVAFALTGLSIPLLRRLQILDRPNPRSSHERPTPRGGGIGPSVAILSAWALLPTLWPETPVALSVIAAAGVLLAAVSLLDDVRSLPPLPRFAAQFVAVAAGLSLLPGEALVTQGLLPFWLDRVFAALAWLWFVNLFNFMDGIDGISATETGAIGLGLLLLTLLGTLPAWTAPAAAAALGAALGFLVWNRPPARVFLGDVGSVPIGFCLGFLLLSAAAEGLWAAALILPAYYLADATLTLLRRLARGERVWRAHREHFYQRAAARRGHGWVVARIALADALLVALALLSAVAAELGWPWLLAVLAAALAVALALLWRLARAARA